MRKLVLLIFFFAAMFAQNVRVSYLVNQEVLDLLKYMKNRAIETQVSKKVDKLLSHKDYSVMFSFYRSSSSGSLTKADFKNMIMSLRWPKYYQQGKNRVTDLMRPMWQRVYNNLPHLQHKINRLKKINLSSLIKKSVRKANQWLPSGMKAKTFNFIVLADGLSSAYQLGSYQVYDIFQLPIDRKGDLDEKLFSEIISHESHHSGIAGRNKKYSGKKYLLSKFLTSFVVEGSATKLVNNVYGKFVEKIDKGKQIYYFRAIPGLNLERAWRDMFSEEKGMFERFFVTVRKIMDGSYNSYDVERELRTYWKAPGSSKYYLLGSELVGAIYFGFGKKGCFEVMKDYTKLIPLYNQSVNKNRYKLKNCLKVPKDIMQYFKN